MRYQQVSIVLPVHNQEDHIAWVVSGYERLLPRIQIPCEIILVVNGSSDDSLAVCNDLASRSPHVRTLSTDRAGWGRAVRLGIGAARGDLLCYTNSARTSPGALLSMLLLAVARPNVVIKANRKIRDNCYRRLGSLLYNLECRHLFDLPYWDINGTPKIFPRVFDRLRRLSADGNLIDLEFCTVCRTEDYPLLEVPCLSGHRHGGRSTTGSGAALSMYVEAYLLWWRKRKRRW